MERSKQEELINLSNDNIEGASPHFNNFKIIIKMEEKQSSAVAVRKEEAMMNQLKKSVDLVIPSSVQDRELFAQNCMLYLAETSAEIKNNKVYIPIKGKDKPMEISTIDFLQKMWTASKMGLNFGCKEFSLVPFGGQNPTIAIVPDFRVERRRVEEKNITIEFLHGKDGDVVYEFPNPLKHEFPTRGSKRAMEFKTIKGKGYQAQIENNNAWYACIARHNETGEELSYVESKANIEARANPSQMLFYNNPNATDSMYEKFVMRQLIKRLPANWGGENWDKIEDIPFEEVPYVEVQEVPTTKEAKPKTSPKQELKPLEEGSETWFKMIESIKAHKVTIEQIARKYDIEPIRAQIERLFETYEETPEANGKGAETAENSPLSLNL